MPGYDFPNIDRCDAFWARREVDRPLLASWVGHYEVARHYEQGLSCLPEGKLRPEDIDFEYFRADYERLFELHRRTETDVPWAAFPLMVVPWVEAIAGCPIVQRGGNVWAEPWLDSYDLLAEAGFQPNLPWLERLVEFADWLVALSAGRFPVAVSLMRGPADLLAAGRGASRSIYDLYDYPAEVERTLQALTDLWIHVAQAQLAHIPTFAGGYCFSVQNLWSRQPGGWFQDDAVAYWSPPFYRQFVRGCEEKLAGSMAATGIHLHPVSLFTVDDLVDMPQLDVIEVNVDDVGPRLPEMISRFQQILQKKRLLILGVFSEQDLHLLKHSLPTTGLALQIKGDNPEVVQATIEMVKAIWPG